MSPTFNRRGFIGAGFGSLAAAMAAGPVLLGQDKPATVEVETKFKPDTLFLTWQQDPTTTITIQWISKAKDVDDPVIRFSNRGKAEWQIGPIAKAKPYPVVQSFLGATGPIDLNIYRAELTGLVPGTEYDFKIGLQSPIYRFRTMPSKATKAFSFISGGDCGTSIHALNNNRQAAKQDPMFALIGGDLGYDNGTNGTTALKLSGTTPRR